MATNLVLRTARKYYEEAQLESSQRQLSDLLFPQKDESTAAAFSLDSLVRNTYGISYRESGAQSHVRAYEAGKNTLITPPRASEKTPIGEALKDSLVAGAEETASFDSNKAQLVTNITRQHEDAFLMTKNKQALDTVGTGEFLALGLDGKDLDMNIKYNRKPANNLTYDFTGSGTFTIAISDAMTQLRKEGTPAGGMCGIFGQSWLNAYSEDDAVQKFISATPVSQLLNADMLPKELDNVQGLFVVGQYRPMGSISPMWILSYSPSTPYIGKEGDAAGTYIADDEAIFFSIQDERYTVNRGVDVIDDSGKSIRVVGDLVADTFSTTDPVEDNLRTSTRHAYVPGNINHTAKSTGTFA